VLSGGFMEGAGGDPLWPIDWMHLKTSKNFAQNCIILHKPCNHAVNHAVNRFGRNF